MNTFSNGLYDHVCVTLENATHYLICVTDISNNLSFSNHFFLFAPLFTVLLYVYHKGCPCQACSQRSPWQEEMQLQTGDEDNAARTGTFPDDPGGGL